LAFVTARHARRTVERRERRLQERMTKIFARQPGNDARPRGIANGQVVGQAGSLNLKREKVHEN